MGQAGSHPSAAGPQRARRVRTLPHEPLRHAPKVLPSLTESPRLRSTDNGAILQSGGTISGRRPASNLQESSRASHGQAHSNVYRSRSTGAVGEPSELRSRERDPLHRSHTNLDLRHKDGSSVNKRFGSEPDLRVEEEQQKPKCTNKHFRKKYRAPPPPSNYHNGGSSPDSSEVIRREEPQRKMRLFKTRNETKNLNGPLDSKLPSYKPSYNEYRSLDYTENTRFERRYLATSKADQNLRYPDHDNMVQSATSLKREENLLQTKQDYRNARPDKVSGCRAKTTKANDQSQAWKTPLLNKNFRYSERFKKEDIDQPPLRREKTFDSIPIAKDKLSKSPEPVHESKIKTIGEQLKSSRGSPQAARKQPLGKSLPSLLPINREAKDEFQIELKKATSRIRNELVSKINVSENKTSQNDITNAHKPNPTKFVTQSKVKESSLSTSISNKQESKLTNNRKPLSRLNETKPKATIPQRNAKNNIAIHKDKLRDKENGLVPDRGQASGKESSPERSPLRKPKEPLTNKVSEEKQKTAPSRQFYFGMNENKQANNEDRLKDFPGLGSPIIEEISNFHLIEKKLLGYHEEDDEFERFNAKLKKDCKVKNISSESALSSDEGDGSEGSLGIAVRLRPTPPKKQPTVPRFSPAAAWKQLASLDAHLAAQTQPLAVEIKMSAEISAESSPRSDQSTDKSGDSGISGDHANSDHRVDSLSKHHVPDQTTPAWTPQQDLGDSSSDGAGGALPLRAGPGLVTYNPGAQPFSLSLPRDNQDKGKQMQQGFNSLQKLKKSVSGALGAALGSRRFDLEHEPMLEEPEQNWFLTKSAPNSLSNTLFYQPPGRLKGSSEEDVIKEETSPPESEKDNVGPWRPNNSYLSWGGHVMYLPPAPTAPDQPLSMLGPLDRPVRSKSSGSLEVAARAARAAALAGEMREKERSASPDVARALPARVEPVTTGSLYTVYRVRSPSLRRFSVHVALRENRLSKYHPSVAACKFTRGLTPQKRSATKMQALGPGGIIYERHTSNPRGKNKRFTFQSTVRQLERRKIAEKLSKEADLKEQQRRTELEAMRRVEEEFQRKRAREKANIRQQLRLVSSGASSMPHTTQHNKTRDEPDGSCRASPAPDRGRNGRQSHSNASSEISTRSKSSTPVRCVELSEWRTDSSPRVYRDWASAAAAHAHPPACARMPKSTNAFYNAAEASAFSGSPRSDNYRLEFARGRSPRTPRPPRLLSATRTPSSSGSELSLRQPIKISTKPASTHATNIETTTTKEETEEPAIVPTVRPVRPARAVFIH